MHAHTHAHTHTHTHTNTHAHAQYMILLGKVTGWERTRCCCAFFFLGGARAVVALHFKAVLSSRTTIARYLTAEQQ